MNEKVYLRAPPGCDIDSIAHPLVTRLKENVNPDSCLLQIDHAGIPNHPVVFVGEDQAIFLVVERGNRTIVSLQYKAGNPQVTIWVVEALEQLGFEVDEKT